MRQWLIQSSDGTPRGPATTTDVARAVHAGILDRRTNVAPTGSPNAWQSIASIREIERAIAELAFPENDEGDEALRTLIASPAELVTLEDLERDAEPDSTDDMRRLAPTAHGGPLARAARAVSFPDVIPDSEPRTLIARSPFDEGPAPPTPAPVYVVMPKTSSPATTPARTDPAHAQALAAAERREVEEASTVVATPDPRVRPQTLLGDGTASGARGHVVTMTSARRRALIALAFAGGLAGGLAMLLVVYAIVAP